MGLETHICVENTAIDFRRNGYEVHTVADCCVSRTQEDRLLALEVIVTIFCKLKQYICICIHDEITNSFTEDARHRMSHNYLRECNI